VGKLTPFHRAEGENVETGMTAFKPPWLRYHILGDPINKEVRKKIATELEELEGGQAAGPGSGMRCGRKVLLPSHPFKARKKRGVCQNKIQ